MLTCFSAANGNKYSLSLPASGLFQLYTMKTCGAVAVLLQLVDQLNHKQLAKESKNKIFFFVDFWIMYFNRHGGRRQEVQSNFFRYARQGVKIS